MKIADLKQPYKRMAEYLAEKNANPHYNNNKVLKKAFSWAHTNYPFWDKVNEGECPQITEEIKKHFPPDFDFLGEEIKTKPVMQMLDTETQKTIYTQLAKEGKFDELPDTCEFSEAVELEVWDSSQLRTVRQITGKYKDMYVDDDFDFWDNAKLPTPKIDFSEFKTGDVVEFQYDDDKVRIGYINSKDNIEMEITHTKNQKGEMFNLEKIKSITKIK